MDYRDHLKNYQNQRSRCDHLELHFDRYTKFMTATIHRLKAFLLLSSLFAGLSASAMTACPAGTSGGKPVTAWLILIVAVIIASIIAVIIARRGFRFESIGMKAFGMFAGLFSWLLVVYGGFLGWFYFMFTCFQRQ